MVGPSTEAIVSDMAFFGFMGPFPSSHTFDELVRYGEGLPGAGDPGASTPNSRASRTCWAPIVASENGVTVAISGDPVVGADPNAHSDDVASFILRAYRASGRKILETLSNPFALAIVDPSNRRALLAVDQMGIERVTFAVRSGGLAFGSSAESVAMFPPIRAPLSSQAIYDYLLLHMVPAPDTVFAGVSKLRPGTCAIFEHGQLRVERYWYPQFPRRRGADFEALKNDLHVGLRTAVRETNPDEHTGAFLSGGLDSSTVAGVLSEISTSPAKTFSIGFSHPKYDERPYARIASARFRCQAHEYVVQSSDIAEIFPRIARAYDEPFGNSSALPVYYCARLAREHNVQHLLAGDGGDELFAGNTRYAEQQLFERYHSVPRFLRTGFIEPLIRGWPPQLMCWPVRKAQGYVKKANTPLPSRLEAWNTVTELGAEQLLHPDFFPAIDPHAPFTRMHEVWDAASSSDTVQKMLFYDWQYTLSDNDLRKVQCMTALAGVRVSYPMLHRDVISLSLRVPTQLMMPGMRIRHFYKRAMQDWLPGEIIEKKKHGFGLPFGLWLKDSPSLRDLIFGNLADLRARRIIHASVIERLLHLHNSHDASHYGVFLWVLAMLEQWFREHQLAPDT